MRERALLVTLITGLWIAPVNGEESKKAANLKAHEWGTFTTLHWPGGRGLSWYQNTFGPTSDLPGFVAGFGSGLKSPSFGRSTARMETPVIYFYADKKMKVDVKADYPSGRITEYFPVSDLSMQAVWKQLEIIPPHLDSTLADLLPTDPKRPDNHYFEAREVPDAAYVRRSFAPNKKGETPPDQVEKFIFYRGVGTFDGRLMVDLEKGAEAVTLNYYHREHPLQHAWLLETTDDTIAWKKLDPFAPYHRDRKSATVRIDMDDLNDFGDKENAAEALKKSMVNALTEAGLTKDEATSMVATWRNHWFEEPGRRVLSISPQQLIDQVLPLTITPQPSEVVRVFVHRQELLSYETVENIKLALHADTTSEQARKMIADEQLGRFVHGTIYEVADDIARKHVQRGFKAIQPNPRPAAAAQPTAAVR